LAVLYLTFRIKFSTLDIKANKFQQLPVIRG